MSGETWQANGGIEFEAGTVRKKLSPPTGEDSDVISWLKSTIKSVASEAGFRNFKVYVDGAAINNNDVNAALVAGARTVSLKRYDKAA